MGGEEEDPRIPVGFEAVGPGSRGQGLGVKRRDASGPSSDAALRSMADGT